ncbi:hypothetical protein PoB_007131800 [Plakobranchus ocellatus]|uniref:Uncharacterized protein n=1 Tax=Plakobranchus ocellatus TaxID=259542 RepID=A0AAV4DL74_9GAST|nr:hypothetical protein PoB_007131800 [Plakobranchus ocellatus]
MRQCGCDDDGANSFGGCASAVVVAAGVDTVIDFVPAFPVYCHVSLNFTRGQFTVIFPGVSLPSSSLGSVYHSSSPGSVYHSTSLGQFTVIFPGVSLSLIFPGVSLSLIFPEISLPLISPGDSFHSSFLGSVCPSSPLWSVYH